MSDQEKRPCYKIEYGDTVVKRAELQWMSFFASNVRFEAGHSRFETEREAVIAGVSLRVAGMSEAELLQQKENFGKYAETNPHSGDKFGSLSILRALQEVAWLRGLIPEQPDWSKDFVLKWPCGGKTTAGFG